MVKRYSNQIGKFQGEDSDPRLLQEVGDLEGTTIALDRSLSMSIVI